MYLITVEGGDGSGKGEAVRILKKVAEDFPFPKVSVTHEPRRNSDIGSLAMKAVQSGDRTPLEEAGLFAADRVDHSHTWIHPRLERGELVISDRNVHSSLVYQGIIGELGVDKVARINSGALVPDLVVWVDCDPEVAMRRISSGTLRVDTKGEGEYFETLDYQVKIREGFQHILAEDSDVPPPFDICKVAGPIINEGSKRQLQKTLTKALRDFLNARPPPNNVEPEVVDRNHLARLVAGLRKQQRLPGAPTETTSLVEGWLGGSAPAELMEKADVAWEMKKARKADVTGRPISHPSWAILGTLSFIGTTDIPRMRRKLGPVRSVTSRHSQRMIKWFDQIAWTFRQQAHVPFSDAPLFKVKEEWVGLGRLWLAMRPLMGEFAIWRRRNPDTDWSQALSEILYESGKNKSKALRQELEESVTAIIDRLSLLTSGHVGCPAPTNLEELLVWWSTTPPK